jgi:hypothetical protein
VAGIYRDPLIGLRARIADIALVAEERESRFAPDLLPHLPLDLRERLEVLRDAHHAHSDSIEELARAERAGSEYLELLDRAIALAPELEVRLRAIPEEAPELRRRGPGGPVFIGHAVVAEALAVTRALLQRVVARHDRGAAVKSLTHNAFTAQLHAYGAPLALLVECFVNPERPFEPMVQVATGVAEGTPRLHVAPETWTDAFARTMGLRARAATGDEGFDGRFVIEGDPFPARVLLGGDVRAALLAIAREDVPDLLVDAGRAILSWSFEPSERALDAAFFALGRLRTAEVPVHLLAAE